MPSGSGNRSLGELNTSNNPPAYRDGDAGYFEHSLAKKGQKIQVFVKILEIDTGVRMDRSKTIGTISVKNGGTILMSAHSGYSSGQKREEYCLDTKRWNFLALRMSLTFEYSRLINYF
jgi:hypothetical protein